jgi:serine/threonine-protein kinase
LSSIINSVVSWVQYLGRRYDDAIEQCKATLEMDPNYYAAHLYLGESYEQKGMYAEARASLERARKISGGRARDLGALGHLYAVSGNRHEALAILKELERQSAAGYVEPFYIALVHLGLGNTERALDELQKSQDNGFPWMIHWNVSPRLDPLRDNPRFVALLRRAGFLGRERK